MDPRNRLHTRQTFALVRAESLALMTVAGVLLFQHRADVRWGRFLLAFLLIDLVGYLPGAIAYRRAGGRPIAPIYHHLYNVAHSYLSAGLAVSLWALWGDGLEWAMLALPLHLAGDRGLFGNTYKPTELSFEPEKAPTGLALAALE